MLHLVKLDKKYKYINFVYNIQNSQNMKPFRKNMCQISNTHKGEKGMLREKRWHLTILFSAFAAVLLLFVLFQSDDNENTSSVSVIEGDFQLPSNKTYSLENNKLFYIILPLNWTGDEAVRIKNMKIAGNTNGISYAFFGTHHLQEEGIYTYDTIGSLSPIEEATLLGNEQIVLQVIVSFISTDDSRKLEIEYEVNGTEKKVELQAPVLEQLGGIEEDIVFDLDSFGKPFVELQNDLNELFSGVHPNITFDEKMIDSVLGVNIDDKGTVVISLKNFSEDIGGLTTHESGELLRPLLDTVFSYPEVHEAYITFEGNLAKWANWLQSTQDPLIPLDVEALKTELWQTLGENNFESFIIDDFRFSHLNEDGSKIYSIRYSIKVENPDQHLQTNDGIKGYGGWIHEKRLYGVIHQDGSVQINIEKMN